MNKVSPYLTVSLVLGFLVLFSLSKSSNVYGMDCVSSGPCPPPGAVGCVGFSWGAPNNGPPGCTFLDAGCGTCTATGCTSCGEPTPACFLPGTKISMADGTKKNIEDVKVGDKVLSYETDIEKLQAIMKRKYDKQQKENYDNMSFMEKIEFKFQQKWDKWFGFLTPVEMM